MLFRSFTGGRVGRVILGPDETLYALGQFATAGDQVVPGLARWNGQHWESLLSGTYLGLGGYTGLAECFAEHQGAIYMGGVFTAAGALATDGIARWTGDRWANVGGGGVGYRPSLVFTLLSSGPMLYAGGSFTNMGGSSTSNIASWDGTNWASLGAGVDGNVRCLAQGRDGLYAGGWFSMAGGAPATNIARWTGAAWEPLGSGLDDSVTTLAVWGDKLYAGGWFAHAGDRPVSLLACWDGTSWQEVGGGLTGSDDAGEVRRLVASDDGLYVAGSFTSTSGQPVTNLARWDGTTWHAVGGPLPGAVSGLCLRGRTVYVASAALNELGVKSVGVYRLEGTNWIALGSGLSRHGLHIAVEALFATDTEVFVGGIFTCAGLKPSVGIARWIENPRLSMEARPNLPASTLFLRASGDPGLRFDLEASPDLSTWDKIGTGEDGQAQWNMDLRSGPRRFYRAVARP